MNDMKNYFEMNDLINKYIDDIKKKPKNTHIDIKSGFRSLGDITLPLIEDIKKKYQKASIAQSASDFIKLYIKAIKITAKVYEQREKHWFEITSLEIVRNTLYSLRHSIEDKNEKKISWENPWVEAQYPLEWKQRLGTEIRSLVSETKISSPGYLQILKARLAILLQGNDHRVFGKLFQSYKASVVLSILTNQERLQGSPQLIFDLDVTGRRIQGAVVAQFRHLVVDENKKQGYYPVVVGLGLNEADGDFLASSSIDAQRKFWEELLRNLKGKIENLTTWQPGEWEELLRLKEGERDGLLTCRPAEEEKREKEIKFLPEIIKPALRVSSLAWKSGKTSQEIHDIIFRHISQIDYAFGRWDTIPNLDIEGPTAKAEAARLYAENPSTPGISFDNEGTPIFQNRNIRAYKALVARTPIYKARKDGQEYLWKSYPSLDGKGNFSVGISWDGLAGAFSTEWRELWEKQMEEQQGHLLKKRKEIFQESSVLKNVDEKLLNDIDLALIHLDRRMARLSLYKKGTPILAAIMSQFQDQRTSFAVYLSEDGLCDVLWPGWHKKMSGRPEKWRQELRAILDSLVVLHYRYEGRIGRADGVEKGFGPFLFNVSEMPGAFLVDINPEWLTAYYVFSTGSDPKDDHRKSLTIDLRKPLNRDERKHLREVPYNQISMRLRSLARGLKWSPHQEALVHLFLREITKKKDPKAKRTIPTVYMSYEKQFCGCNGKNGRGYKIQTWIKRGGYLRRTGSRGLSEAFKNFLNDLSKALTDLQGYSDPLINDLLRKKPSEALELTLKIFLPLDTERLFEQILHDLFDLVTMDTSSKAKTKEAEIRKRLGELTGSSLRDLRSKNSWTQENLAHRLGKSQRFVSSMELGRKPIPKDLLPKLMELLLPSEN